MSFSNWIGETLGTRKWRERVSAQWAKSFYPGAESELAARVVSCLIEQLGITPRELKPEDRFHADIDLPDLQDVELAMAIEDEFGIKFSEEELSEIEDLASLITAVANKT